MLAAVPHRWGTTVASPPGTLRDAGRRFSPMGHNCCISARNSEGCWPLFLAEGAKLLHLNQELWGMLDAVSCRWGTSVASPPGALGDVGHRFLPMGNNCCISDRSSEGCWPPFLTYGAQLFDLHQELQGRSRCESASSV